MKVIVWNSQGARWDDLWTYFVGPAVAPPQTEDVYSLLVESGWAPWMGSGEVVVNNIYPYDEWLRLFDEQAAAASAFCQGVASVRRRKCFWIPWMQNLDPKKTNTRVSMGGVLCPVRLGAEIQRLDWRAGGLFRRPIVQLSLAQDLTIFSVHLVSGNPGKAQQEIDGLVAAMRGLIPESTAAIIVGDMNIDLLQKVIAVPNGWRILRTGAATQKSGGELDWALLYDPRNQFPQANASVLAQYKTPPSNNSDHSVLQYAL